MAQVLRDVVQVADWLKAHVQGELRSDSRLVKHGDAFIAWPGAATDGRQFVKQAIMAGATAAVVEHEGCDAFDFDDPRVVAVPGLKSVAGSVAALFYESPSNKLDVVAITGTNGKTSCAWWTAQLLNAAGRPCGVVGTLGVGMPSLPGRSADLLSTGLTTPDPVLLHAKLRGMATNGLRACAIEASSIGLVEGRLNALTVKVAVFTNFSQDHLDYHGSMADYWAAKASLFHWTGLTHAVVNLDDEQGVALDQALASRPAIARWSVGIDRPARLMARDIRYTDRGMRLAVVEHDEHGTEVARSELALDLIGRYNVSNLLCVIASARALGVSLADALGACTSLTPVPGRMEQVDASAGQPLVLVDYAHTPDALEKALQALQPVATQRGGRLWCVIGCGGDRDPGKRPLMAAVAEREAQQAVLTSDNPRSEDPLAILAQMRAGLARPEVAVIEADRARAIAQAVCMAGPQDVVLVAGKGHEDYQEVMGVKRPFSDVAQAREALRARPVTSGGQA